jgi:hypothetical protein
MELENNNLTNDIIIIDGLWGVGKSLLGPIISGMENVEKVKIEYIYEHVATLHYLEKINDDAASWMLKTYADSSQYNNLIGREVNLRWSDDSGLAINPNALVYIKRLFASDGDHKIVEINTNNIALNIMSHLLMLTPTPIFNAYGDRVKIIEIVRHPLYMVKHWCAYLERFDSPREFTVSFNYKNEKVPWFAKGWEYEYIKANTVDKALLCISRLYSLLDSETEKAISNGNNILTISFENLVMAHDEPLKKIESFLGRKHYPKLSELLRKQKIPRKTISQGKGHASYGWNMDSDKSEAQVYEQNLKYIKNNGTSENVNNFLKLIESYNIKYPSILAKFQ